MDLVSLVVLSAFCFFYVLSCPYTKVEESFNLQAIHDILFHGTQLDDYDHHQFPGVVPRSFLGPILVSFVAYPFRLVMESWNLPKIYVQYAVRMSLGFLVMLGMANLISSLRSLFGNTFARWYVLLTLSQFHFLFYATRPLPNVFALVFVLNALSFWLQSRQFGFIMMSAVAVIIFRGELAMLLAPIVIMDLVTGRLNLLEVIKHGVLAAIMALSFTVIVDTWFWKRILWPEGEVLYYNVILNKSSNWGVSPWPWYFYSAIPRALCLSTFLVPIGTYMDLRTLRICLPAFIFIVLFSFLPHKELRFIIYSFPLLNVPVAAACQRIWQGRSKKSVMRKLLALAVALHLLANLIISWGMLFVSSQNYPGGQALQRFHQLVPTDRQQVHVHLDNLACQTGISRFTELNSDRWHYNKTEHLDFEQRLNFTHLVIEDSDLLKESSIWNGKFEVLDEISGYHSVTVDYKKFPPVSIKNRVYLYIMKKKKL